MVDRRYYMLCKLACNDETVQFNATEVLSTYNNNENKNKNCEKRVISSLLVQIIMIKSHLQQATEGHLVRIIDEDIIYLIADSLIYLDVHHIEIFF